MDPADVEAPVEMASCPLVRSATPEKTETAPLMPPAEPAAEPLPTITLPLAPEPAVPLLNTMAPEDPAVKLLALRMTTKPLDDTAPAPLTTLTTPPVEAADCVDPADK